MILAVSILVATFLLAIVTLLQLKPGTDSGLGNFLNVTSIVFIIFILGLTIWQLSEVYEAETNKNAESVKAAAAIKTGIDSGLSVIIAALKKNSIDFDSLKNPKKIILPDSSATINIFKDKPGRPKPQVDFDSAKAIELINNKGNLYNFRVNFKTRFADAASLDLKLYSILKTRNHPFQKASAPVNLGNGTLKIPEGRLTESLVSITNNAPDPPQYLIVIAKGSFWDVELKRKFPCYSMIAYDFNLGRFGTPDISKLTGIEPYLEAEKL